jgi:hypothetical protein
MLSLIASHAQVSLWLFAFSAVTMAISLLLALWEVLLSGGALNIYLNEMAVPPDRTPSNHP